MDFKLILLSVTCFAFVIQPAQSGVIIPAIINTAGEVVSIAANGVRGAIDIGSILTSGAGYGLRAIARASAAVGEGGAKGLITVGDTISKLGDTIVGDKLVGTSAANSASPSVSRNTRILLEAPVVQDVVENVKEVVDVPVQSFPIRQVELKVRRPETIVEASAGLPSVYSLLMNSADYKFNDGESIRNIGGSRIVGGPVVYEVVESPRTFQGPVVEAFQV